MVFTMQCTQKYDANVVVNRILLNNKLLQQVSTTKFIGVTINEHLNWADHIHQVKSKISNLRYSDQTQILILITSVCIAYNLQCSMPALLTILGYTMGWQQ